MDVFVKHAFRTGFYMLIGQVASGAGGLTQSVLPFGFRRGAASILHARL
jgi:hypothetical protein